MPDYGMTDEGFEWLQKYFLTHSNLEFYNDIEERTEVGMEIRLMLLFAFGHSYGQYDYSMYELWAREIGE